MQAFSRLHLAHAHELLQLVALDHEQARLEQGLKSAGVCSIVRHRLHSLPEAGNRNSTIAIGKTLSTACSEHEGCSASTSLK